MEERAVSTSISLKPSDIAKLKEAALTNGYNSRNELISTILINWLKKNSKKSA